MKDAIKNILKILWISQAFLLFYCCNKPISINDTFDSYTIFNKAVEIVVYYNGLTVFDRYNTPDDLKTDCDVKIEIRKYKVVPIAKLLNKIKGVIHLQQIYDTKNIDFTIRCDILSYKHVIYSFAFSESNPDIIWINGYLYKHHDDIFPLDIIPYLFLSDWKLYHSVEGMDY
ncbi:MAG: hypothetical protein JW881_05995 [Spirochaetales bacterium]|nr:hypothetical protein [Spirochaetales bacterium]